MNRAVISLIMSIFILLSIGCAQPEHSGSESAGDEEPHIEGPAFVLFYTEN